MGSSVVADIVLGAGTIATAVLSTALVVDNGRHAPRDSVGRGRLRLGLLAAILFLAHGIVARSVAAGVPPATADPPVLGWLVQHRTGPLDTLFIQVSALGGTVGMTVAATVAATVFWIRRHRWAAAGLAGAAIGSLLLFTAAKSLYGRSRPPLGLQLVPQTTLSLPSGHALVSITVLGLGTVLIGSRLRTRTRRVLLAVPAAVVVGLIGLSRLYLGVHWMTDVLAGWLLGAAWLVVVTVILRPHLDGASRPQLDGPEARKLGRSARRSSSGACCPSPESRVSSGRRSTDVILPFPDL